MTTRTHVKSKLNEAGFIAEEAGELADRMLKSIPSSLRDDNLFFEFSTSIKNLSKWNGNIPAQDARRELYIDPSPLFSMWKLAYDEKSPVMKIRSERLEKRLINLKEPEKPKPKIGFESAAKAETLPQIEAPAQAAIETPVEIPVEIPVETTVETPVETAAPARETAREPLASYLQHSPSLKSIAASDYSTSLFFNQAAPPQYERAQKLAKGNRHARRAAEAKARHREP
ncbi:MAG: hypothetical protein DI586_08170 [Micavibrio aeruginosavorus]|uniref:Uncharacterized protein n=1 Tax=Micavibrio aeruginosavorus TaxID=349221 RepID=A0A2W5HH78_9BACT|nr:MAG: hypothetical protein DI586_08170 [Micavibrio aeruginosavorus]